MTFGQKVRNARVALKMTQAELAGRLGKHRDTVLHYEDGAHQPRTMADRQKLAEVLQIPYNDLFRDDASIERREIGLDWDLLHATLTDGALSRTARLEQARLWKSMLRYLIADSASLTLDDQQKVSETLRLISKIDGIPQDAQPFRGYDLEDLAKLFTSPGVQVCRTPGIFLWGGVIVGGSGLMRLGTGLVE